jgi:serine/threonine protein kinase/DNA-binding beta-propeller fold protein YncE
LSDQDPQDFRVGSLVAGYRLEERIGQGGMAVVFRAYDPRLDRRVALKVLPPGLALDEAFRQRFIRESRAAAAVDDAHIIPVFEAGESDGVLFIAMRYVRGGDLRSLIGRAGPLPSSRVAEIVAQMASALDAAHALGLVHRDVKPANMLLEPSTVADRPEHVYLSDFGLSKGALAATGLTATGQFLGTLDYVSPEQIEGRPIDGRADEYALACSAFEMLCGEPPFQREQGVSVMYAHLSEAPPSVRARRPELPPEIDEVLAKAMAKAPGNRYATCREFAVALRPALGIGATGPEGQPASHPATEVVVTIGSGMAADSLPTSTGESLPTSIGQPERSGPPHDEPAAQRPQSPSRRPWWRSPVPVAGICVLAVLLAGGGFLAARGHGNAGHGNAKPGQLRNLSETALALPGCTTATAKAPKLTGVVRATTVLRGSPFGVAVSADGQYSFVTTGNAVAVLRAGSGLAPSLVRTITVHGADKGLALTPDGRFLVVADGSGAVIINVAAAEDGAAGPVAGSLTSPAGSGAVEVLISADGKFAFVTLQNSARMAVFNLGAGLAQGFGPADFVGYVPLAAQPVGMASYDAWLYVTSLAGTLAVVSISKAETSPAHAVVATVRAGCGAARALIADSGKVVWVTARQSDALLAFSTARLLTDPKHALLAKVMVGEVPLGEALADNGNRIIVADSNLHHLAGVPSNLAVISTASALSGRPALLGYLPVGPIPRQFAVEPGGTTVLVTLQGAHELEAVDVWGLR